MNCGEHRIRKQTEAKQKQKKAKQKQKKAKLSKEKLCYHLLFYFSGCESQERSNHANEGQGKSECGVFHNLRKWMKYSDCKALRHANAKIRKMR
jgi:hypothetical protein